MLYRELIRFFGKECGVRFVEAEDPESAGIAQLVERNLAKVEVASSNLVSRSN